MEIDVVLPCLNEAGALPWVLSRMPSGYRPIIADNGSTDDSAAIAAAYGAHVVHVPQRGFGAACHAGLLAASGDVVCVMDADASFDPGDLPAVAGPVAAGDVDLMLGRRSVQGKGAWPLHARIGNWMLAAELRRRVGVPVRDLGPMRAARREALLALPMSDRRFGYPLEMVVRAAEAGWRIAETDVPYYPRTGKSKVTGTLGGTVRTVRDMRRVLASIAAPASPAPVSPGPASPGSASPGPASPGPASPGPASPGPASPGPASPGPASPGSASPGSASPVPASPAPALSGQASS